jgi:hypothetical protein
MVKYTNADYYNKWNDIIIDIPKKLYYVNNKNNLSLSNSLTKQNNISKKKGLPSIILKAKNIDYPIIENKGELSNLNGVQYGLKLNKLHKKNLNPSLIQIKANKNIKPIINENENENFTMDEPKKFKMHDGTVGRFKGVWGFCWFPE